MQQKGADVENCCITRCSIWCSFPCSIFKKYFGCIEIFLYFFLFILINQIFQQQFFPNHGCRYDPGRVPTTSSSDGSDRTDISALEADLQLATNEIKLVVQGMSHCMSNFIES